MGEDAEGGHCSLEWCSRVAVSLEGAVDDVGSLVDQVRHDWLTLRTIPRNISWNSHSVSVASSVVLVEHWGLSSSPLAMRIWNWRVSRQNFTKIPPEEIWIVQESSLMESAVVENNWSLVSQTSSNTLRHEEKHVCISNPASSIEILDW